MAHIIDQHPVLVLIPGTAMTKEQHDRWVEQTGRPVTDPWVSIRYSKHAKHSTEVSARNKKELVPA